MGPRVERVTGGGGAISSASACITGIHERERVPTTPSIRTDHDKRERVTTASAILAGVHQLELHYPKRVPVLADLPPCYV